MSENNTPGEKPKELLPCPFCGGPAGIEEGIAYCENHGPERVEIAESVWNTRCTPPTQPSDVARDDFSMPVAVVEPWSADKWHAEYQKSEAQRYKDWQEHQTALAAAQAENEKLKRERDEAISYANRLRVSINGTGPADVDYILALEKDNSSLRKQLAEAQECLKEVLYEPDLDETCCPTGGPETCRFCGGYPGHHDPTCIAMKVLNQ